MPTFDRFVFVMSVLERYSDQESSLLPDCTLNELVAARIRACSKSGHQQSVAAIRRPESVGAGDLHAHVSCKRGVACPTGVRGSAAPSSTRFSRQAVP